MAPGRCFRDVAGLSSTEFAGDRRNPLTSADAPFNGSVGLPLPSTEIAIRDEADHDLGIGGVGEICAARKSCAATGAPDESAQVMLPDGWLPRKMSAIDERGFVFVRDRKKDMIIVSGFKVYQRDRRRRRALPGRTRSRGRRAARRRAFR